MLKLLLDEHISPDVAVGLRRQQKRLVVHCVADWEGGRFLGMADDQLLQAAIKQKLTLVTYDRRTIPPLLKVWAESGRVHAGVIVVDEKTVPPSDFGGLIQALRNLHRETAKWDWTGTRTPQNPHPEGCQNRANGPLSNRNRVKRG
jgi:hypothetical protein